MKQVKVTGPHFGPKQITNAVNDILLKLHNINAEVIDIKYTCKAERGYGETYTAMIVYETGKIGGQDDIK